MARHLESDKAQGERIKEEAGSDAGSAALQHHPRQDRDRKEDRGNAPRADPFREQVHRTQDRKCHRDRGEEQSERFDQQGIETRVWGGGTRHGLARAGA